MLLVLALLLCCSSPLLAQVVTPPEMLGSIAGPGAVVEPAGVRFYGTDLGWTFEHRGQHFMLFGDTWPHARSPCDPLPHNDDSQVTFPLTLPPGLPTLTVATEPAAPNEFARIRLLRDGESLVMGYNKTPLTAFSDGTDAIILFGLVDLVHCRRRRGRSSCRPYEHLTCSQEVGICAPPLLGYDAPCDLFDTGILYAPNIIDAYTRADGAGGLDVFWNVSVWNPYLVALLKTNVRPSGTGAAAACASGAAERRAAPFRWCAAND